MTDVQLRPNRSDAVKQAKVLNLVTIGWNSVEGVVAVLAGVSASSASLVGFGIDSGIEVSAAMILAWRLANERHDGCQQAADQRAQRGIAISFMALSAYVLTTSLFDLVTRSRPEESTIGIAIAALSLLAMPVLARQKRRLADDLGSRAAEAEANQTDLCTMLSAALLLGLAAHSLFGWWWADPLAGVFIDAAAGWMARATWQAESLADTCCA